MPIQSNRNATDADDETIKRSIENMMEPIESDESGSLHFQAPPTMKEEEEDVSPSAADPGAVTREEERKKKATFASRLRCRRCKISNVVEDRWYTKEEIMWFRQRDKCIQTEMISSSTSLTGDDDTDEVSFVGLYSGKDRRHRSALIRESRARVMREQSSQEENFFADPVRSSVSSFELDQETISSIYFLYSRRPAKIARMRALEVSSHVKNLWEEEDNNKVSSDNYASIRCCSQSSSTLSSISTSSGGGNQQHRPPSAGDNLTAHFTI